MLEDNNLTLFEEASTSSGIQNSPGSIFYIPDQGCFAEEGKNYEKNVTAFITLEALKNVDDFCLISNPINCAPFDDIILCTKTNGVNVIYLFQIKSKLNPTAINDDEFTNKIKSKFFIGTFYEKYPQGINGIRKIIPQYYGEGCKFKVIIFTNRPIQENSEIFEVRTNKRIFSGMHGKIYKFNSEFINNKKNVVKRDFLQSIDVYADQCDIDNSSIMWIKQYFNSEEDIAKKIKFEYFKCIKNWCEIKTERESLTKEFIYKLITYATFKNFAYPIDNYNKIDYYQYQEILQDLLSWESIQNSSIKINCEHIQYILGLALEGFHKVNVSNEYYEQIIGDGLQTMQTKYDIGCLLGILPFIVRDFNLAMPSDCLKDFKIVFIESNGGGSKGNLSKIALDKLTVTTSSGQIIKIGNIIEELSEDISISDLLSSLLCFRNNYHKEKPNFIRRRLNKVLLDPEIFKKPFNDKHSKFVINTNGISAQDFIKQFDVDKNHVLVAETENRLEDYFKSFKFILINKEGAELEVETSINVHFLNLFIGYEDTLRVEWIKSIGDTEYIRSFRTNILCEILQDETMMLRSCECCVPLEHITSHFQNRFLIISGVPGIGKTTCLRQFACLAQTNDLIIFVTLMEFYDYFELFDSGETASAENHIINFCNEQDKVFKQFFLSKLKKKEVIILFDGFDEIAPKYTVTVAEIIKEIRRENYKVILTTRNILESKVESLFGTFCISLCPFGKAEQQNFLKIYFDNIANNAINSFIGFQFLVDSTNNEFRMIPLNLHLICEVLYEELQKEAILPYNFTLNNLELYEKFINYKLNIYTQKIANKNIDKSIINSYHKYFSISKLFNKLRNFNMIKEHLKHALLHFNNQLKTGAEKVGILIDDINEVFIHRTVAEYYAAKWLFEIVKPTTDCEYIKNEKRFAIYILKLVYKINYKFDFFNKSDKMDFEVIKSFLDSMIVRGNKLHEAAIAGDHDYIITTFHSDITTVKTLNGLNRTLLHTIILRNDLLFFDKNLKKINTKLLQVLNFLLTNFPNILSQKDVLDASIYVYVKQKKAEKIQIFLHESFVYCNRVFEIWELFYKENLYKCDIYKVLQALETQNRLYTVFDAASDGNLSHIKQFYEWGLNINICNKDQKHVIHFAAEYGHLDIVIFLNKYIGDKLNSLLKLVDNNARTVLHYAVVSGNLDIIIYLRQNKVNIMSYDFCGLNAFQYAIIFNQVKIADYFLTQDFNNNNFLKCRNGYYPIHYAAAFYNKEMFKFLLKKGADVNCKNLNNGDSLMHFAISVNKFIIKKLNKMFPPFRLIHKNLLYVREEYNMKRYDVIQYFLEIGGDINLQNSSGYTALHYALLKDDTRLAKYLIDNQADVNLPNCKYEFPLDVAACFKQKETVSLILKELTELRTTTPYLIEPNSNFKDFPSFSVFLNDIIALYCHKSLGISEDVINEVLWPHRSKQPVHNSRAVS